MSLAEGWAWSMWTVFNPISVRSYVVVFHSFSGHIGQTTGCPTSQRIVYMGVAADCEYTSVYGSPSNATQQIITNWNTASALYKSTFNVSLGIIELQVHDAMYVSRVDLPWRVV